jgi:hypothetical protein
MTIFILPFFFLSKLIIRILKSLGLFKWIWFDSLYSYYRALTFDYLVKFNNFDNQMFIIGLKFKVINYCSS